MPTALHQSDSQRREFVAYIAVAVAVLFVLIKAIAFILQGDLPHRGYLEAESGVSLFDRVANLAGNSELLGVALLTAAFLLMLDSESESKAMRFSIFLTSALSALLLFVSVIAIAHSIVSSPDTSTNSEIAQAVIEYLATMLLAFAAFGLTWPVVSNPNPVGDGSDEVEG